MTTRIPLLLFLSITLAQSAVTDPTQPLKPGAFTLPPNTEWTSTNVKDFEQEGATISGKPANGDPMVMANNIKGGPNLSSGKFRFVEFELQVEKNHSGGVQIFFGTSQSPPFAANKSASLPQSKIANDGKFHTYRVNMSRSPLWKGRLVNLRVDVYAGPQMIGKPFTLQNIRLGDAEIVPLKHVLPPPTFAEYKDFPGFTEARKVQENLAVDRLRCEYRDDPAGIDEMAPRLGWRLISTARGQKQTAYRIIAASSPELLDRGMGDLWDSGRVSSSRAVNVVYEGKALSSRLVVHWKVRVWDKDGQASAWSKPAHWSMGLLKESDWQADYISHVDKSPIHKDRNSLFLPPAQQYRKEFAAKPSIKRATIYATALGIYELHINGRRVDDTLFAPGWTDYRQRAYYYTHDATHLVKEGQNAIGAWIADGWYSGYVGFGLLTSIGTEKIGRYTYGKTPAFKAQLEIEYNDGSRKIIPTDNSWKVTGKGPIQDADFLMGEHYDARRELDGWATAGFDDSKWESAILAAENGSAKANFWHYRNPPSGKGGPRNLASGVDLGFKAPPKLEAFPGVPVRPVQEIKAVGILEPKPGVYVFNLGQNFAGVVRFKGRGKAGQEISLRHGEMLHHDGSLMTANLRRARAQDFYVFKGDPNGETYTPRFTFHGFQFVEVTGLDYKPGLNAITGVVLQSDTPDTSEFECSDPVINRLYKNTVWTQKANFLDLPTDCPQRDERMGWTGDAQVYVRAATYNADVAAFYTKWLRELMESQRPSGAFPGYAPFPFQHGWDFGTAWADAGTICPWTIWQAYDDTRIIEACWKPMTRFMDWRQRTMKDYLGINHGNGWGDWLNQNEPTPFDYVDTIYLAHSAKLMSEMASAIGRENEAANYADLFKKVKAAFGRKYLKPNGSLTVDTQTAYALALFMDLVPEKLRTRTSNHLARKIRGNGTRMTTGFLGTRPILPVLSRNGHHDLAMQLLQSHRFPSWGYEVLQGATTIWERWDSYTAEHGFDGQSGNQNASMNSFAHYSFGAVVEWMFYRLAGIELGKPGFKHLIIQPTPATPGSNPDRRTIDWVKAAYGSINGRIISEWRIKDGTFESEITVPPNTTATVLLPAASAESITESSRALPEVDGVKFIRLTDNRAVIEIASGHYKFSSEFPDK